MTVSSALAPVIGLVSAPLLTNALGVDGRGALSVATAPNVLLAGVATFGLPEALTYFTAKSPRTARPAILYSSLLVLLLCVFGVVLVALFTPFLTNGDASLAQLVLLGSFLAVPLLLLSLVRGVAAGLQMWGAIAAERVCSGLFRLLLLVALLAADRLTVLTALLAVVAGPLIGVLAYARIVAVWRHAVRSQPGRAAKTSDVFRYGSQTWLGAVAGILLSRINQLLFAPLSDVSQLGLYVVAVTISDVPLITALAIRDALFGVNSKQNDAAQLAATTRMTVFIGAGASGVLALTMPFWLAPVFGEGFAAAVVPTQILLLSTVVNIPAFLTAAGLAAWGRPGLRSVGLVVTLVVNLLLFVLLVPAGGAVGAGLAALGSAMVSAIWMTLFTRRVLQVGLRELLIVRWDDLRRLMALVTDALFGVVRRARKG